MNVLEESGGGPVFPNRAHSFSASRDVPPPVAEFTTAHGDGVREITFHSTSRSRVGGMHFTWSFGDGTFGSGSDPTHTYAAGGTYDVTLEVSQQGPLTDSVTHPVDPEATNVSRSATIVVHLASKPVKDPGRFDVRVDGTRYLGKAGHGKLVTVPVAPGVHTVAEAPTNATASKFAVTLSCRIGSRQVLATGSLSGSVNVPQGSRVDCTFTNVRRSKYCVVPRLAGLSLSKATKRLKTAHCKVGKVVKHGKKKLVVTATKPAAGTVKPLGSKVKLTLRKKS